MKVNIKITIDQLEELNYALQHERFWTAISEINSKVYNHLFIAAFSKLQKKAIDKRQDFNKKPFKISFTYPEAAALMNELNKVKELNPYRYNLSMRIKNEIHNKLS